MLQLLQRMSDKCVLYFWVNADPMPSEALEHMYKRGLVIGGDGYSIINQTQKVSKHSWLGVGSTLTGMQTLGYLRLAIPKEN